MTGSKAPDPERDFEQRWREWAARPPRKSAAFASTEVKRRLRPPAPPYRWRLTAAAAAVLALSGILGVRLLNPPKPTPNPSEAAGSTTAAPLAEGEVLIWLDSETPLYMTYQNVSGGTQ